MTRLSQVGLPQFLAILALLAGAAVALPGIANPGIVFLAGLAVIEIVIALAFNFLFSTVGILSFGQAAFILVGAYGGAAAIKFAGLSLLPALLVAGLVAGLLALAIGVVALRRVEGVYFAVLTLAFASLAYLTVGKVAVLGREDGLTGITRPAVDLGIVEIPVVATTSFYYFIVAVGVVLTAVMWFATNSQFGRVLRAIRQDQERAGFLGVNVQGYRLAAFVLAGAVTGIAGALLGPWTQIVTPDLGHWIQSTKPILQAMLGGAGFFWGPVVGAILFAVLTYATRTLVGITEIVTGGLLLAIVLAIPGGLLGLTGSLLRMIRRERSR
ncbi:MAG: branched-chain amino acid ABC transporter permease [Rhizobiaceae bacterium]|nr:branched-chain amino acid ABC transporter permease [Rhizobiaceae bacterium]